MGAVFHKTEIYVGLGNIHTDILGIPQYHFNTDYNFVNTVFKYYLMYSSNLLCI